MCGGTRDETLRLSCDFIIFCHIVMFCPVPFYQHCPCFAHSGINFWVAPSFSLTYYHRRLRRTPASNAHGTGAPSCYICFLLPSRPFPLLILMMALTASPSFAFMGKRGRNPLRQGSSTTLPKPSAEHREALLLH